MFVFSLKASKLKYVLAAAACAVVATVVILLMPDAGEAVTVNGTMTEYANEGKVKFEGIKGADGVKSFAKSLGYSVDEKPLETVDVKIPAELDAVLTEYNNLQKSQGFNLLDYKNKNVTRYTFKVTGLPDFQSLPSDDVLFTVILYKDKVIGGDVYFTGKDAQVSGILK